MIHWKGAIALTRKFLLLAAALCASLLLGACAQVAFDVDSLMNAPVLTPEQTAIKTALLDGIGVNESGVQFRYPKAGDYRSAFVMHDLDGDGADEALVFYNLRGAEDSNVFISVLSKETGEWRVNYRTSGEGTAVDSVAFESITDREQENIVVAWTSAGGDERTVSVYTYQPENRQELLREEGGFSYTELRIHDFNKDGLGDLLLLTWSEASNRRISASVAMLNAQGELRRSRNLVVGEGYANVGRVQIGLLDHETEAIFIDASKSGGTTVTSILAYDAGQPVNHPLVDVVQRMPEENQLSFRREQGVTCTDVNGDGMIEVPYQTRLPGYTEEDEDALYATEYMQYREGVFEPVWYGIVNMSDGYRFKFPDRWEGQVSATHQGSTDELYFFAFRGNIKDDTRELLRLRTNRPNRPADKFNTLHYESLDGDKGTYECYIPPLKDEPLAMTLAEVAKSFTVLNSSLR